MSAEIDDLQQNLADSKLKYMEKVDSSNTDKLKYEEQLEFLRDHEKFLTTQVYLIVFNVFLNFQLFYFA